MQLREGEEERVPAAAEGDAIQGGELRGIPMGEDAQAGVGFHETVRQIERRPSTFLPGGFLCNGSGRVICRRRGAGEFDTRRKARTAPPAASETSGGTAFPISRN